MKIKAILVDDEPKSRNNLHDLLQEYCQQVEIVGEAASATEALKLIKQQEPELIFLDIEMPGGSGFDLLKSLNDKNFEVIFVTAFDQYGIQAVKFCAIDYILKPIDIFELSKAVEKAQAQILRKKENRRLVELVANIDRPEDGVYCCQPDCSSGSGWQLYPDFYGLQKGISGVQNPQRISGNTGTSQFSTHTSVAFD